jgi:hypothetical protein
VGTQPKQRARNPHHGEPSGRRRHGRDPKGTRAEAPRSRSRDVPLMLPFHTPVDNIGNTTKELCSVATQYSASNEAAQLRLASANVAIQDDREGTQGGTKRCKQ